METSRLAEFRKELTKMPQFHAFSALLCRNSTPYKRTHSYSAQTADHVLCDKSTRTWNIKANKNRGKIPAVLSSFGLVATFFRALDETILRVLENSSELYSDSAHASNVVARKLGKRLGPEMDTHVSFFFFCNMFPAIIINFIVWLLHADSL